jgi:hypothetical protein
MLNTENIQDELSRTAKMFLDSGEAPTVEHAYDILGSYKLSIRVGSDVAGSPTLQASLLTAVNTARRCFLGGVEVANCPDAELLVHTDGCRKLDEAIARQGGRLVDTGATDSPQIVIGDIAATTSSEFSVRATFDGWIGGVAPVEDGIRLGEVQEFTPAGVLAGSLAVSEAFQFVRGKNPVVGTRRVGLSLWEPDSGDHWATSHQKGPKLECLPSRLWLIGLGHLGQAYLWTLGMLPYASPNQVLLVLQDTDVLSKANDSTSPLTDLSMVGQYKTRAMASWCEARGFKTRIVERLFTDDFRVVGDEPMMALCGVDNGLGRAALEDVGFAGVIEAGLGRGTEEYLAFQLHHFPGSKPARAIWAVGDHEPEPPLASDLAAYRDLEGRGLDQCGVTRLADRAVGASFVGTFTSTLVVAELLRVIAGGRSYEVIDGTLRHPESADAIARPARVLNPGITPAGLFPPQKKCPNATLTREGVP